ncbi:MAG: dTMP kinase [Slackia sp.]|nr:dTMP kinase [Slackia sp.]
MTCDAERFERAFAPVGVFVTFEGGEGAGKSTHIAILAAALRASGRETVCVREPGGTAIGEQLRGVVLDPSNDEMAPLCELFVYEAARAQLVREKVLPALERGAAVLCDRFCDSTVAYQAYGRGIDERAVRLVNEVACQGLVPARTIVLEAPSAAAGLSRAASAGDPDRLERAGAAFHDRVNAAFRAIAQADPDRVAVVSSRASIEDTAAAVYAAVAAVFPELSLEALLRAARDHAASAARSKREERA